MDHLDGTQGWALVTTGDRPRGGEGTWLGPLAIAAALAVAVLGCKQESSSAAAAEPSATKSTESLSGKPSFDEEAFTLSMAPKGSYAAGEEGEVEIHLKAKSGFKCNDQYPFKFKTKASPDVTFAAEVVRKDAVRLEGKNDAYMTVKLTPKSAGKRTIEGQFSFSVCTEEQCLVERRDLSLAVDVR